jgi:hypothetical protein
MGTQLWAPLAQKRPNKPQIFFDLHIVDTFKSNLAKLEKNVRSVKKTARKTISTILKILEML